MKILSFVLTAILFAGCRTAAQSDFKRWTERVSQVHLGMRREDVERILPPAATRDGGGTTITGGAQGVQYFVAPGLSVLIFYDYTGVPRGPSGEALSHAHPDNRVIELPRLEHRPSR